MNVGRGVSQAVGAAEGSPDFGVAWHFGDPFGEQRALVDGRALVDLSHRAVIEVTGTDRLSWLHSLTTQHVAELAPNESALALILDRHGRVEHELHLINDLDRTFLIVEGQRAAALLGYLDSMRFLLDVQLSDTTVDWAVIGSGHAQRHASSPTWIMPLGFRHRLPRSEFLVARSKLGVTLRDFPKTAGTWAWESLRVAAGVPRVTLDTDHRTIPHEVGWIGTAVHLHKACYPGQETVTRVEHLGKPPRRLVILHLDGSADANVTHGAAVWADGRAVGTVGSVAQHYELGPIALATIKRQVPADTALAVDSGEPASRVQRVAASQESILTSK